jgi:hypothetical protein
MQQLPHRRRLSDGVQFGRDVVMLSKQLRMVVLGVLLQQFAMPLLYEHLPQLWRRWQLLLRVSAGLFRWTASAFRAG